MSRCKYILEGGDIHLPLIKEELERSKSLTSKLDSLLKIHKSINKYLKTELKFHEFVEVHFNKTFEGSKDDPKFKYWFLKYNAKLMFDEHITSETFKAKLVHPLSETFLKQELRAINKIENRAKKQTVKGSDKMVDPGTGESKMNMPYNKGGYMQYYEGVNNIDGIEYLRVIGNYYKVNPTEHSHLTIKSPEVIAYFKHNLLKPYLESKVGKSLGSTIIKEHDIVKKIPAKYYALYHWVLIEMGRRHDFNSNDDGNYIRREIEAYATEAYSNISAQGFYKAFIHINITNKLAIANSFGEGYKDKLIQISNYDPKVISHLKKYPGKFIN